MCDIQTILTVHLNHMTFTSFNLFHLIAPFANEFANLITISGLANLYPHKPEGYLDLLKIYTFDILALTGIISNAIIAAKAYNHLLGVIGGILYLIFAFTIPNVFMHDILYSSYFSKYKVITGLVIIYCLELIINLSFCLAKSQLYTPKEVSEIIETKEVEYELTDKIKKTKKEDEEKKTLEETEVLKTKQHLH